MGYSINSCCFLGMKTQQTDLKLVGERRKDCNIQKGLMILNEKMGMISYDENVQKLRPCKAGHSSRFANRSWLADLIGSDLS